MKQQVTLLELEVGDTSQHEDTGGLFEVTSSPDELGADEGDRHTSGSNN
jgi:hypothetical protein